MTKRSMVFPDRVFTQCQLTFLENKHLIEILQILHLHASQGLRYVSDTMPMQELEHTMAVPSNSSTVIAEIGSK